MVVDPDGWSLRELPGAPALARPIDVGFAPGDDALYVLDFGRFEMSEDGVQATQGTGRLWRWESWSDGLHGTSLG